MRTVFIVGGLLIVLVAILNMLDMQIEFPTQSNGTNVVIGGIMIAVPFLWGSAKTI